MYYIKLANSRIADHCISRRRYTAALIAIAMLFNSTFAVMGSAWLVNTAQQYANDDTMMICMGSQFKWVSTFDYFENNELVFVEPPADAPVNLESVECPYLVIAEQYTDDHTFPKLLHQNIASYKAKKLALDQRPYTAYPYAAAQTRAPPFV